MSDQPTVRPEDAVQVAQRALAKANEMDDLRDRLDDLEEELTAVRLRLSEIDEDTDYQDLSLDAKIGMVREHAYRKAVDGHGRAALTYEDVKWEVFDGRPGNNHCYRLMRLAAGYDNDGNPVEDVPGFDFDESSRPMKLTVDAAAAKAGAAFSPRNKTRSEEVV